MTTSRAAIACYVNVSKQVDGDVNSRGNWAVSSSFHSELTTNLVEWVDADKAGRDVESISGEALFSRMRLGC
jgi:aspartokinase